MLNIERVKAEVTNVNPRKENAEGGKVLASDVSVDFVVSKDDLATIFAHTTFLDQFYSKDLTDTRNEVVFPIRYGKKITGLVVSMYLGAKPLVFEGSKIAEGALLEPVNGGYVAVKCKLQVYPTQQQSGKLDESVKEHIELSIESATADEGHAPEPESEKPNLRSVPTGDEK